MKDREYYSTHPGAAALSSARRKPTAEGAVLGAQARWPSSSESCSHADTTHRPDSERRSSGVSRDAGTRDRKCSHQFAGRVIDGRSCAAHAHFALFDIHLRTHRGRPWQIPRESWPFLTMVFSVRALRLWAHRHVCHESFAGCFARATHQHLAEGSTVHGQALPHSQPRQQHSVGLNAIQVNDLVIAQHRKVRGLARFQGKLLRESGAPGASGRSPSQNPGSTPCSESPSGIARFSVLCSM